jgi:DNA-directed RNA polymerase specialized sigma24 family protein
MPHVPFRTAREPTHLVRSHMPSRPTPEAASQLQLRLLAGDADAPADLLEAFAAPLIEALRRKFRALYDPDLVDEVVFDTLLSFPEHPQNYDPLRGSLWNYLYMDAYGNIVNAYQREKRLRERRIDLDVADAEADRNENVEEEVIRRHVSPYLPEGISMEEVRRALRELRATPEEWCVMQLMVARVRPTGRYAEILGLSHLPVGEQRREVKKVKDRVRVRLRRLGARLDE